jgi:acetyl-CoA C-acetyltransferase
MTHSIAAMVETLRADPGSYGVTSGVGMHMQKHAYGLWSTAPGVERTTRVSTPLPPATPSLIIESPEGTATVATYSVLHGRNGEPESAVLVCDLPGGRRCYAKLDGGVAQAEVDELIGRAVSLSSADGVNLARVN